MEPDRAHFIWLPRLRVSDLRTWLVCRADEYVLAMAAVSSRTAYLLNSMRFAAACHAKLTAIIEQLQTFRTACEQVTTSRCLPHMLRAVIDTAQRTGLRFDSLAGVCQIASSSAPGGSVVGRRVLRAAIEEVQLSMPSGVEGLVPELSQVRSARRLGKSGLRKRRDNIGQLARGARQVEKELGHLRQQAGDTEETAVGAAAASARRSLLAALSAFCTEAEPLLETAAQGLEAACEAGLRLQQYFGVGEGAAGTSDDSLGHRCIALAAGFIDAFEEEACGMLPREALANGLSECT